MTDTNTLSSTPGTTINIFPPTSTAAANTNGYLATTAPGEQVLRPPIITPQDLQARRAQAFTNRDRKAIKAEVPPSKGDAITAVIRLYDVIDSYGMFYGVSAREFASVLDELPDTVTEIRVLINSPGGEATEGMAILNLLRNHPATIVSVVEGMAGSAASVIAVGSDALEMNPNSELIIHDAWGLCIGNAAEMRDCADMLDHLSDSLARVYAAKAGGTVEDWRAVMAKDTWYSAEEAVAAGLADSVTTATNPDPTASARFDRSIFARATVPAPKNPADHPAVGSSATTEGGPAVALSDEHDTNLREKLGVAADADGDSILAAIDALLEQATAPDPNPDPAPLPEGVVAISEAQLAQLKADAQQGIDARAAQIKAERESLVQAAVADGRIAPAEREAWLSKLETGTGAETVLAALKPGLIPVASLGSGGAEDLDSDAAIYAELFGKEATV